MPIRRPSRLPIRRPTHPLTGCRLLLFATLAALGALFGFLAVAARAATPASLPRPPARPCAGTVAPRTYQLELLSGGLLRHALVHVPPSAPGRRMPLLLALHGAGQDGQFFERYTGFSAIADGEGFVAVYPSARPAYPSPGGKLRSFWAINDSVPGRVDDVRFLSDVLDRVESVVCIDRRRVYATGVSNGGGMAVRAGCALSRRIAAIAPIAGGYRSLPACRPEIPMSVLEIHGTSDASVPYDGRGGDGAGAVDAFLNSWVTRDHCHRVARRRRLAAQVIRVEWLPCRGGTVVAHLEVYRGTHQLPGALPRDQGPRSTFSGAWEVWSFLRARLRAGL